MKARPAISPCGRQSERWVLAATIIGSSLAFIDGTVVNVALPVLQNELHVAVADVQWVVEAYLLLLSALLLVGGALGDHYGRRRIFLVGIALFALASLRHVPESSNPEKTPLDIFGAVLVAAGLGALVYGLIESARPGFART